MKKNIKWCAIQPLTGGMYLGTEKAIGCKAQFILSYPGFGDPIVNKKTNELVGGGNEYHLMTYLNKVNRRPEYKIFNRKRTVEGTINLRTCHADLQQSN